MRSEINKFKPASFVKYSFDKNCQFCSYSRYLCEKTYNNKYFITQLLLRIIHLTFNFKPKHCLINISQGGIKISLNIVFNTQEKEVKIN